MINNTLVRTTLCLAAIILCVVAAPASPAAQSKPASVPVIAAQETNTQGVTAEVIECRRKDGVLFTRVRLRNTTSSAVDYQIYNRNFALYYVTAENKKYFLLKDSEGAILATPPDGQDNLQIRLGPGQPFVWWAKFPAPPISVKKVTLVMLGVVPFEDLSVTDEQ
jgi:hypothetical protein